VRQTTDVVQEENVDVIDCQPPKTRLNRASNTVAAVIEYRMATEDRELALRQFLRSRLYAPPDLRGDRETAAWASRESVAQPRFAGPKAIERCRVKMSDTLGERFLNRTIRIIITDRLVEIPYRRAAESKGRELHGALQ